MDTFGERLRAAMLTNGLKSEEQLAPITRISVSMARRWLNMREAKVMAPRLAPVALKLGFRMYWLTTGQGACHISPAAFSGYEGKVMELINAMDEDQLQRWLNLGTRLVKEV